MTRTTHRILLTFYTIIPIALFLAIGYYGYSYYSLPDADQPYSSLYDLWQPAGLIGHGLGILGSFFIVVGLFSYMGRKHLQIMSGWGTLKYWLDFHIFACTLGAIMVLYHTTFKFGGIVSISFWSMASVWLSGVAGRFLYVLIPRTLEGRALNLVELEGMQDEIILELKNRYNINITEFESLGKSAVLSLLKQKGASSSEVRKIRQLISKKYILTKRIKGLARLQSLFRYWHFIHLPFALIMLVVMIIHIVITLTFGFFWIF